MKAYLEIEMPACINCRFCQAGDSTSYCLAQSHELERGGWYMHHIKWDKGIGYEAQKTWREKTCPLVPVPPHGDLIDRDALKDVQQADADFYKGSSDYGEKCRRDEALNAFANIVNAPTIIEAEESAKKDGEQDGPYDLLYEEGGPDA